MEKLLAAFSQVAEGLHKQSGARLFSGASLQSHVYYLDQGFAKIFRVDGGNRESIFAFLGPGSIYGDWVQNGGQPLNYSASMLTDGLVREIPRDEFAQFCQLNTRAWRWVAELEAKRRARLEKRIEIMCMADAKRRLLAIIPFLIHQYGFPPEADGSYELPLKQSEFASLIGSTRETTSSMLNQLQKANLIRLRRGRLIVPDLKAFEEL
jgi:CRP/FNR family transcriptional regulator